MIDQRTSHPDRDETRHGSKQPYARVATFDVVVDRVPEFLAYAERVFDAMRYEATFIMSSLSVHPTEPNRFLMFEVWQDREEFDTVPWNRSYRMPFPAADLLRSPVVAEAWSEIRADYAVHVRRGTSDE
jgi:quinol monooxygenase YgiN